jgi:hypothetical protein
LSIGAVLVLFFLPFTSVSGSPDYICGDADGSGIVNVSDAVFLVGYIFGGGPAPDPLLAGDCDLNEVVNISDAVYLIGYIFGGGPAPCFTASGQVTGWFGCKYSVKGSPPDSIPSDQDCLYWEYDGNSVLQLKHINSGFNCCPTEIVADITVSATDILIEEDEILENPCYCLCLFDVDYEIIGISPREYTILILGLYLDGTPPLQITIDLASDTTGIFCVERTHYPWGIY